MKGQDIYRQWKILAQNILLVDWKNQFLPQN
jgi:hypothetical protein